MRIAIMQPYYLPYIGYFQLMSAVDVFVVYDNIQFTKKGWFHRNRILYQGKDRMFSIPISKGSTSLDVRDRTISGLFIKQRGKYMEWIRQSYGNAPFFKEVYPIVMDCFYFERSHNLFDFIFNSLGIMKDFLNIKCSMVVSSTLPIDHSKKSQEKVISICRHTKTDLYINPIGGLGLYSSEKFKESGVDLRFLKTKNLTYKQFSETFVPNLSILDVLMFNSKEQMAILLNDFDLFSKEGAENE
jgi:hypothetical protein